MSSLISVAAYKGFNIRRLVRDIVMGQVIHDLSARESVEPMFSRK